MSRDIPAHNIPDALIYNKTTFPSLIKETTLERMKTFRPIEEFLIASYPRTGTTWVLEICWLVNNGVNVDAANDIQNFKRVPCLENSPEWPWPVADGPSDPPRLSRTHLTPEYFNGDLLKENCKLIMTIRDPKDVLVSYFHFYKMNGVLGNFSGPWGDFFELFKKQILAYGDYFDWYKKWFQCRGHLNMLVVKYEDMIHDLGKEIRRIGDFFGKSLSDDQVDVIADHVSFDKMKVNKMINYTTLPKEVINPDISPFIRKGQVGDWTNYFTEEQRKFVDQECVKMKEIYPEFEY